MYPVLHEPTLDKDIDAAYYTPDQASPYQHFVCRMVIAISMQKIDTQHAGLADSFYLAALKYLEPVVRPMDLKTLQCFALMAEYSLLTPTRTAIYYVVGIGNQHSGKAGRDSHHHCGHGEFSRLTTCCGTPNFICVDDNSTFFVSTQTHGSPQVHAKLYRTQLRHCRRTGRTSEQSDFCPRVQTA
jgi:hypothetical protein